MFLSARALGLAYGSPNPYGNGHDAESPKPPSFSASCWKGSDLKEENPEDDGAKEEERAPRIPRVLPHYHRWVPILPTVVIVLLVIGVETITITSTTTITTITGVSILKTRIKSMSTLVVLLSSLSSLIDTNTFIQTKAEIIVSIITRSCRNHRRARSSNRLDEEKECQTRQRPLAEISQGG